MPELGNRDSCYTIAEIGVNHDGLEEKAHEMILLAKSTGADAAKFQLFNPDELCSDGAHKEMLKGLTLPLEAYPRLEKTCNLEDFSGGKGRASSSHKRQIDFLCTAFDPDSLEYLLKNTSMKYIKIPSGEITNRRLLQIAGASGKPVILSTGMANLDEVRQALNYLTNYTFTVSDYIKHNLYLLHCISCYPTRISHMNLKAIDTLRHRFNLPVGLSDHSPGLIAPIAAVALGARIIEKHLTHSKYADGPDHAASMMPYEFKEMVQAIRDVEAALGDGVKECLPCEESTKHIARRNRSGRRP